MKKLNLVIPVILILIMTGCSSVRVSSDYDRKVDFRQYRTFNFSKEVARVNLNDLNRRRLKDDITAQMESRGYRLADAPDLLVNVFIKGRIKTTATASNFGGPFGWGGPFGYYRGWGGGWGYSNTYIDYDKYIEGTMFVDLIDVQEKKMIWEGVAQGLINPRTETREKNLSKVVNKIFNDFPLK